MRLILASGVTLFEVLISLLLLSLLLLELDGMALCALRLNRKAYFAALAGQQLQNLEERVRLVGSGEGLVQQLEDWNDENSRLLPKGNGWLSGRYSDYTIILCWGGRTECVSEHFVV